MYAVGKTDILYSYVNRQAVLNPSEVENGLLFCVILNVLTQNYENNVKTNIFCAFVFFLFRK